MCVCDYRNNYILKRKTFAIDPGYFWCLNISIYNLQSFYETSKLKVLLVLPKC